SHGSVFTQPLSAVSNTIAPAFRFIPPPCPRRGSWTVDRACVFTLHDPLRLRVPADNSRPAPPRIFRQTRKTSRTQSLRHLERRGKWEEGRCAGVYGSRPAVERGRVSAPCPHGALTRPRSPVVKRFLSSSDGPAAVRVE